MNAVGLRALLVSLALLGAGCGSRDGAHSGAARGDHEHDHGAEVQLGAEFVEGQGVQLSDEARRILGVEVVQVEERKVPNHVRFTVQVFGEEHRHPLGEADHTGCDVHGSGFVAPAAAAAVKSGQAVEITRNGIRPLAGAVLAVQKAVALGEMEIVVGVSNASPWLKPGEFVPARIELPADQAGPAIPQSAVLRNAEGAFVYVVNGDVCRRRAVRIGAEAGEWVGVTEGLRAGETVVAKPVQALWLIELRATKGGGHTH